jgi:hypothetical protein
MQQCACSVSWCDWIAIIVAIIAAGLIWGQIRQVAKNTKGSSYQSLYDTMIGIDKLFLQPDILKLKPFFYEGKSPETPNDWQLGLAVAEVLCDFFDNVFHQQAFMPKGTPEAFKKYIQLIWNQSPVFKKYIEKYGHMYPDAFLTYLQSLSQDK